ncbi:2-dehydropantoate 2-reductase [Vagococcus lutrae]|uniref:2-dehydropantoate 2-reductase n=1 Tax=Vagococcus lutrae TaxID=81947 RepID=A0AAE9XJG7_9ENTE|nr:2-dehydropantoate 2-reductase [Vagococcus lutrae]WCG23265.1 2-dehydropantoate 2-reductase [Vagococcus lutrae]GEQ62250.1 2-dehydropantoate 2-reductase [Vagococcus lutrae]GEQ64187.1 2-dehydropantoate 2-reductase [Vagococcus lutrae]GEQ66047.1 2-dehydropantoate 2-reductase [Vagococcus lutrae]
MKIAIAGSGALGCGFGYLMHKAGNEVTLIDQWPAHIDAINSKGLTVDFNGEKGTEMIPAVYPEDIKGEFDLVFTFTKSMQLASMLEKIQPILGEDTKVVCLLNGLGHRQTLMQYVKEENILMGTTVWTAGIDAPGEVHFMGKGPVELQNIHPSGEAAAKEVVALLTDAKLNGVYSDNVLFSIWRKACVNGTLNVLCSILDCNIEEFSKTENSREMMTAIIEEFSLAAKTEGVELDVTETVDYLVEVNKTVGPHYPSMHQDLIQNKRPTEVDYLNGAVAKMAEEHNFEAPTCQIITDLIHAKEDLFGIKR